MGGDDQAALIYVEDDVDQVSRRCAQGRAPIAIEPAPARKRDVDALDGLEARRVEEHMHAPAPASLLGDAAHLRAEDEVGPIEVEQPVPGLAELSPALQQPLGVSKVTGRQQVDALEPGPAGHVLEGEVPAGTDGVGRVRVQVCDVRHAAILPDGGRPGPGRPRAGCTVREVWRARDVPRCIAVCRIVSHPARNALAAAGHGSSARS